MSETYMNHDEMGIKPGYKILDLGSGIEQHRMFHYSKARIIVHVDIRELDSSVQLEENEVFTSFNLDKVKFPFNDDEFDYVVASHVLEHTEDPVVICNEIQRIGKAGYIGSPSIFTEIFWNWSEHRWIIIPVHDILHFISKHRNLVTDFGSFFHDICRGNVIFDKHRMKEINLKMMYVRHIWKNELKIKVHNSIDNISELFLGLNKVTTTNEKR